MDTDEPQVDLTWLRGMTQRRVSRGNMLRLMGFGAGALSVPSLLAACGTGTNASGPSKVALGTSDWWNKQKTKHNVVFANWPLYIDVKKQGGKNTHPSLQDFTKSTGIAVTYDEVIQDYESFFGKIRPMLSAGQSTGYDVIVMGYPRWLPTMISLKYLIPLDHSRMSNFKKNSTSFAKNPFYDPGNTYSVPWQAGVTGIGYDPKLTGREITSTQDLMDPAFKGKVGMFGDTTDMPNFALLAVGVEPTKSTTNDWHKAANWLTEQKNKGIVRKYYDQSYIDSLSKGDIYLSMAWSGDIYQANLSGANLKFVVPKEGGLLWADCMCIPLHSGNPLGALDLMDYVYKPDIAAMITEYVSYISPDATAQQVIKNQADHASGKNKATLESLAVSPLVFPTKSDISRFHYYRNLTPKEQTQWDNLFQPIYQS